MKEFLKQVWKYLLPLIIGLIIGIAINIPSCNKQPDVIVEYVEKHDTITVTKDRIVEKTKIKYVDRIDTFYVTKAGDTIQIPDLPITKKIYEDTIKTDSTSTEIKINYSGYNAEIDNVWLKHNYYNQKEVIIKEPKRVGFVWCVGPSGGYSITVNPYNGQLNHGFSAGLTVTIGIGGTIK